MAASLPPITRSHTLLLQAIPSTTFTSRPRATMTEAAMPKSTPPITINLIFIPMPTPFIISPQNITCRHVRPAALINHQHGLPLLRHRTKPRQILAATNIAYPHQPSLRHNRTPLSLSSAPCASIIWPQAQPRCRVVRRLPLPRWKPPLHRIAPSPGRTLLRIINSLQPPSLLSSHLRVMAADLFLMNPSPHHHSHGHLLHPTHPPAVLAKNRRPASFIKNQPWPSPIQHQTSASNPRPAPMY